MGLNVDKVFRFVQFVSNKQSRGWVSPEEFNISAELAQIAVYSKLENAFLANKKIHSDMRPFLKASEETIAATICPFPAGFRQLIECRMSSTGYGVTEYTQAEITAVLNSPNFPPTESYPACVVRDTGISMYGATAGDVIVEFIGGLTTAPMWNYTIVSNRPVYSAAGGVLTPTGSVDFEFEDNLFLEISTLIIANVGMNIKQEDVTQFGMAFNKQG